MPKIRVKASGSSNGRTWVVVQSLPLEIGLQVAALTDLSDFSNIVKADGSVPAAPAVGSELDVVAINLRRYHKREGEGDAATYSPLPSFALELVVS